MSGWTCKVYFKIICGARSIIIFSRKPEEFKLFNILLQKHKTPKFKRRESITLTEITIQPSLAPFIALPKLPLTLTKWDQQKVLSRTGYGRDQRYQYLATISNSKYYKRKKLQNTSWLEIWTTGTETYKKRFESNQTKLICRPRRRKVFKINHIR